MIKKLSKDQYFKCIRPIMLSLYHSDTPDIYTVPFAKLFEKSLLIYEYAGLPNDDLLDQLVKVSRESGDSGFYLSYPLPNPRSDPSFAQYTYHWFVPFDDVEAYKDNHEMYILDFILLSPNGRWALFPSDETFAVLSGNSDFINRIIEGIPNIDNNVINFLDNWKLQQKFSEKINVSWVKPLIHNIYGQESINLLERVDFG